MNNFDYKNMTPFKWFVLENFPFIENDFEAINNYRLFSKVVEYLNKIIDNVNVLGNLVEQFSNYFDNLDVQEEIDNKLDKMVEDGTFQSLIDGYTTIPELTNRVENLEEDNNTESIGCVLRPTDSLTNTWKIFGDSNHQNKGISSVEMESNRIKINFDKTYGKIISFDAFTDEILKQYGIDVGVSCARNNAYIYFISNTIKNMNIICNNGVLSCNSPFVNSIEWEGNHIKLGLKNVPGSQWANAIMSSSATNRVKAYFNVTNNRYINITINDVDNNIINESSASTFNINVGLIYQGFLNPNFISIWDSDLLGVSALMFSATFNKE